MSWRCDWFLLFPYSARLLLKLWLISPSKLAMVWHLSCLCFYSIVSQRAKYLNHVCWCFKPLALQLFNTHRKYTCVLYCRRIELRNVCGWKVLFTQEWSYWFYSFCQSLNFQFISHTLTLNAIQASIHPALVHLDKCHNGIKITKTLIMSLRKAIKPHWDRLMGVVRILRTAKLGWRTSYFTIRSFRGKKQ